MSFQQYLTKIIAKNTNYMQNTAWRRLEYRTLQKDAKIGTGVYS